jgi:hypothetical protein
MRADYSTGCLPGRGRARLTGQDAAFAVPAPVLLLLVLPVLLLLVLPVLPVLLLPVLLVAAAFLVAEARRFSRAYMSACFPSPGLRRSISNSVVALIRSLSLP